jgi:hypothetical protein
LSLAPLFGGGHKHSNRRIAALIHGREWRARAFWASGKSALMEYRPPQPGLERLCISATTADFSAISPEQLRRRTLRKSFLFGISIALFFFTHSDHRKGKHMVFRLRLLVAIFLLMALTCSVWAIDTKQLEKDLWEFAAINAYLDVVMHPGVPRPPSTMTQIGRQLDRLDAVKRSIYTAIMKLESLAEATKAQEVVDTFKNMHGFEKEVGIYVDQTWLRERIKFLQTQGG